MTSQEAYYKGVTVLTVAIDSALTSELERIVGSKTWMSEVFHSEDFFSAQRRPSFGPKLRDAERCIAFVNFESSITQASETSRYLVETFGPRMIVVAVCREPDSEIILSAMRSGCSELLSEPIQQSSIETILDKLEQAHPGGSIDDRSKAEVFVLAGAKGGVGTTMLAVHLATFLAERHGKHTLLIDHHAVRGHAAIYLGLQSRACHFEEAVRNLSRMDSELLQRFVTKHSSGLEVLTSPDHYDPNKQIDASALGPTLEFLRGEYDYIVVDCDLEQRRHNQAIFAVAQTIYLVGTPEVAAARDLSRCADELTLLDESANKVRVIVNRYDSPFAIASEQIENATKLPVAVRIPNGYPTLIKAANLGEPLSSSGPTSFSEAIAKWTDEISGEAPKKLGTEKEWNLFSAWKRRPLRAQGSSAS